jgi:hypothetical protein
MASSTWLDGDTAKRADALKFQSDTDSDLWSLAFHLNSESSLAHLDSLVEQPAPRPSHAAMPTTPELPDPAERQQWQSVQQPDLQPQQWRSAQPEQNASGQELYSPEERYGQPRPVEMAPIAAEQSFDTQPATPVSNVSPGASAPPIAGSDPEAQARIYQRARASGLDDEGARVLVAVSETEGGTRGAVGDNGQSRGVYQFHEKGEMPAFRRWVAQQGIEGDPNQLAVDPDVATRYAAEGYLGQAIARGRQLGYTGADLATYVQRTGQRSVDPARTGSNYERLFGQGAPPQQDSGDQAGQPGMSTAPTVAASQQQQEVAQSALDDPDKWALCGPVAAVNAAQAHGKTWTVAQAKQIAQQNKLWDAGTGMYGLESQVKLLNQMGVSSRTGAADPTALAKDAQSGNTPIISTPKHYFLLKGYNPQTGEFDTGASGTVLRGGKRWMTLAEISNAGGGIQGAAYMDNPTTPAPSTVAPAAPTAAPPQAAGSPAPVAAPPPAAAGASDMVTIQQIDSGRQITVPTASLPGYMQSPAPGVPAMWRVVDGGGQADMRKLSLDGDPPQPMPGSQGPYDQSPPSLPGATLLPDESSVGPSPDGQTWIDRRNERSMYRQPLGGPPVRDRWADDPSQQPYDPDQGPRESGYTLPSADVNAPSAPNTALNTAPNALHAPAPTYNDPTTTGTQHQPIVASPTTYGDSGDFLPMPAWAQEPSDPTISDPNYTQPAGLRYDPNDPSTGVNPLAPGSLRPTDIPPEMQGARPWLPATTPAGGITPPPGVLDSIVPRAAQTGPLFEGPTAPTRWSPEFQAQYGQGGEAAPFQDDQREPGYRPTPSPRTLSPYQPGSANALVGVPTAPSDQEILAGQGPIARRIDAIDREQRDQSPGYAAGSAMLTPDSLITPENRQTFMQNAPGSTPSSLVAWHDRITAGGADALAAGLGQDPDRAVVAVTIGGMPVRMTVSDLLENVTDPAFGAGFSVGDVVLDAVGQRALHIVAPYVKGAARAVVNRLAGEVRSLPEIVARGARAVGEGLAPTPGRAASDAPGVQMLGAGMVPSGSTLRNAAQGAVVGAASEEAQAWTDNRAGLYRLQDSVSRAIGRPLQATRWWPNCRA